MTPPAFFRGAIVTGACCLVLIGLSPAGSQEPAAEIPTLVGLSFDELLEVEIISASQVHEKLSEAPATVIVISGQELLERGYTELSQILDDLPGMEVIRPYGATYLKNYWRGYRNSIGDPFLIMVDGVIMNHLYFNTAGVMATFPLASIDRVEVVYGPASPIYGPNAFMGVINVITVSDRPLNGTYERGFIAAGTAETRLTDLHFLLKRNSFRLSLAARIDDGTFDDRHTDSYEYSRSAYYGDRRLWGGFLDDPDLGGRFSSPRRNRAADLRLYLGDLEFGLSYYCLDSGYGVEYAADRAQNHGVWKRPQLSLYLRADRRLTGHLTSRTLLRYRKSDVSNDSYWLEGLLSPDSGEEGESLANPPGREGGGRGGDGGSVEGGWSGNRLVQFSYWQSDNSSWSLMQDLQLLLSDRLSFNAGLKYEQKDLQKEYGISYGPALPPAAVDAGSYPYPSPSAEEAVAGNRITTTDTGAYLHGRYRVVGTHQLHFGLRADHSSEYGWATTIRSGYVGSFGRWTVKALYGEAFQEPNPRVLYGGWTGSGSDPTLDPERSRTVELSAVHATPRVSSLLSVYRVRNHDTIVNITTGARNLGGRTVLGLDLHLQALLKPRGVDKLRLWGYYSHLFTADERKLDASGMRTGTGPIGDLADHKLMLGITATFARRMTVTVRARYLSARRTVLTNPVRQVPSFVTVDAVLTARETFAPGLSFSLQACNLLDERYYHPGVREANAGIEPGYFDDAGEWHGSGGYFNSLLAQPGRTVTAMIRIDF